MSNTAVSKACCKANISRPGSGFWAKLRSGKCVQKIDMPLMFPGISDIVRFGDRWMTTPFSCKQNGRQRSRDEQTVCWEDKGDVRLESILTDVLNEIVMQGEIYYRNNMECSYQWAVKRREDKIAAIRQKQLGEEQAVREKHEKEAQARLELLLLQAASIQQADTIRQYVDRVKNSDINVSLEEIERWASWALAEADRIDPLKNLEMLDFEQGGIAI